VPADF